MVHFPNGGADENRIAAFRGARTVLARVGEMGHANLTMHILSARLCCTDLADALLTALMVDEQSRARVAREGDDPVHRLAFRDGMAGRQVPCGVSLAACGHAAQLLDDVTVLG